MRTPSLAVRVQLSRRRLANHPGHDQKSHGRKGSGGQVKTGQDALDSAGSRGGRPDYKLEVTNDPGWTDAERSARAEALRVYSSEVDPSRGDSAEMQAQLRGLPTERDYTDDIANIDDVMAHSPLPSDVETFRGMSAEDFARHGVGQLVGREWTELGYSSTSPIRERAESYADRHSQDGGVMLRVRAPAGTGAVAINPRGTGHTEKELVLERGLSFRVTADHGVVDGVRNLDVEVVARRP